MNRTVRTRRKRSLRSFGVESLEDRRVLAALSPGNLLISTEPSFQPQVREYDTSGALVQQFNLPAGGSTSETIRDLVVDRDGNVQIYHGTFDPTQDELDPFTGSLSQISVSGWSTINNVSYGGIATLQDYVFVTDMATAGDGSPKGILRIDTSDLSVVRFSDTVDFTDLTLGLDGQLYGLTSSRQVYRFDPISLAGFGNITLGFGDHRGIAVNDAGEIFTAAWDGAIYHYDAQGTQLNSLATGVNDLTDIDNHSDGTLAVGSRFGTVVLTDETLAAVGTSFSTGSDETFVAFTDGPFNHAPQAEDATFSIAENSANGTLVGQVTATDIDGDNLTYAITAGNESGVFAVDGQGNLTVADSLALDYESQTAYSLTVRVTDPGQLFADAAVTVDVLDVNDVAPTLTASSLTISEGQSVSISSSNLAATDEDSDDSALSFVVANVTNGQFLVGGVAATTFDQSQVTSGQVSFAHDDSELAPTFDVYVTDGELVSLTEAGAVVFTNVNDNPPVIPAGQGYSVGEDANNGTLVGTVLFSDSDLPGDTLTASIVGGNQGGVFAIDNSGWLTIADNSNLDYESVMAYDLSISVFDGAHTTSESVSVNVLNVNDVAPVLTSNTITIDEGQALLIGGANIAATDADSDDGSLVFDVSNVAGGTFQIDGTPGTSFSQDQITNGDVTFVHDDSEFAPSFDVSVSDGVFTTTPESATIVFSNVNDQPPLIPSGQGFSVSEAAANGTLVGTVVFSDGDLPGDTLAISITAGDPNGTFAIDPNGNLTVADNSDLDYETTSSYSLEIQVFDGVFTTAEIVAVNVLDVSETKFFVPDSSADSTFEYAADGSLAESYSLDGGNSDARGATADSAGSTVWVVDNDKHIYVYDAAGNLQGDWQSSDVSRPQGIATDDNDIWLVDSRHDKVYRYSGGAAFTSGSHAADSSFSLNSSNKNSTGITTDGNHIWIVNDKKTTETVFKYTVSGTLVGSWSLDNANTRPEGITIDPSDVNDIWIVDKDTDEVFRYTGGAHWDSGTHAASETFDLAGGNTNPRGIADPPPSHQMNGQQNPGETNTRFAAAVDLIWGQSKSSENAGHSLVGQHEFDSAMTHDISLDLNRRSLRKVALVKRTLSPQARDAAFEAGDPMSPDVLGNLFGDDLSR